MQHPMAPLEYEQNYGMRSAGSEIGVAEHVELVDRSVDRRTRRTGRCELRFARTTSTRSRMTLRQVSSTRRGSMVNAERIQDRIVHHSVADLLTDSRIQAVHTAPFVVCRRLFQDDARQRCATRSGADDSLAIAAVTESLDRWTGCTPGRVVMSAAGNERVAVSHGCRLVVSLSLGRRRQSGSARSLPVPRGRRRRAPRRRVRQGW